MTNEKQQDLSQFLDEVCKDSRLRVEEDLGCGFVRLKSAEAERRQAAQDIRCVEDALIEMLRNSRDAGAKNIFVATCKHENSKHENAKHENIREIVVIDDGCGVPEHLTSAIFDARVTSKLDTFHEDKWGVHGRGMALYSISQNSSDARVVASAQNLGTSIYAKFDLNKLPEKKDQSTPPTFILGDEGRFLIRGPHNITRTATEFALEHRNILSVYVGSPAEIAAALYFYARSALTPAAKLFFDNLDDVEIIKRLAYARTPEEFSDIASSLGLDVSARGARRIQNGEIKTPASLWDIVSENVKSLVGAGGDRGDAKATKKKNQVGEKTGNKISPEQFREIKRVHISKEHADDLARATKRAYSKIADSYYLDRNVNVDVKCVPGYIKISIPLIESG